MGQYSVKRTVYKQADDFLHKLFFYKPMGGKETVRDHYRFVIIKVQTKIKQ